MKETYRPKTKVIFIVEDLSVGGVTRWAINLVDGFELAGISTEIISLFPILKLTSPIGKDIKIRSLNSRGFFSAWINLVRYLYKDRHTTTAVISSLEAVNLITASSMCLTRHKAGFFPVVHFHLTSKLQIKRRWSHLLWSPLLIIAFLRAKKIITVSEGSKNDLISNFFVPEKK